MNDTLSNKSPSAPSTDGTARQGVQLVGGKELCGDGRGIRYFARVVNRRDESAPKVALATDRGRE